jgi:RND family efflux transporter MFP subunit
MTEDEFGPAAPTTSEPSKLDDLKTRIKRLKDNAPWNPRRAALVAAIAVVLLGALYKFSGRNVKNIGEGSLPLVVSMGEAGKAGDVLVTEEALKLAEIDLSPAKVRHVEERLEVTGLIETGGNQIAKVTPQAPGKVVELLAFEGDDVKKGQVLALLESAQLAKAQAAFRQAQARLRVYQKNFDRQQQLADLGEFGSSELEESRTRSVEAAGGLEQARRSVSEQKRAVVQAQSQLKIFESQVVQAEADLSAKRTRWKRAESLPEVVSLQQLERLRADLSMAESEVAAAKAQVVQGRADVLASKESLEVASNLQPLATKRWEISESARSREEKIFSAGHSRSRELLEAETALELAQAELQGAEEAVRLLGGRPGEGSGLALVTPIDGKVQEASLTLGETVDVDQVAFTVMNLEHVWAELSMAPKDLAKAKVGNSVELQADSAPGQLFVGHISSIGSAADNTTRTVSARMVVENPSAALKVGTFVKASIITDTRLERLTVPETALQEHTGRATIYVANPAQTGSFEVRHVILGEKGEGWREISDGLKADEMVATQGTFYLKSEAMKASLSDGCCASGSSP